jgi:DNA-binding CsgD family transcriptional regulator
VFRHRILPPRTPTLELTDAQLEALRLAACGLTSKQIAERLGITEQAAHLRLKAAGHNLGARNRTHAVAIALRLKLIRLDEVEMGREAAQTPASRPEKPQRPGSRPEPPTGRQTPAQPIRDERNAA